MCIQYEIRRIICCTSMKWVIPIVSSNNKQVIHRTVSIRSAAADIYLTGQGGDKNFDIAVWSACGKWSRSYTHLSMRTTYTHVQTNINSKLN